MPTINENQLTHYDKDSVMRHIMIQFPDFLMHKDCIDHIAYYRKKNVELKDADDYKVVVKTVKFSSFLAMFNEYAIAAIEKMDFEKLTSIFEITEKLLINCDAEICEDLGRYFFELVLFHLRENLKSYHPKVVLNLLKEKSKEICLYLDDYLGDRTPGLYGDEDKGQEEEEF